MIQKNFFLICSTILWFISPLFATNTDESSTPIALSIENSEDYPRESACTRIQKAFSQKFHSCLKKIVKNSSSRLVADFGVVNTASIQWVFIGDMKIIPGETGQTYCVENIYIFNDINSCLANPNITMGLSLIAFVFECGVFLLSVSTENPAREIPLKAGKYIANIARLGSFINACITNGTLWSASFDKHAYPDKIITDFNLACGFGAITSLLQLATLMPDIAVICLKAWPAQDQAISP
jgi:hypothetical protein